MTSRKTSNAGPARSLPAPVRVRPRVWAGVLVIVALSLAGWLWWRGGQVRRDPSLSVILITIDTLRADALGAYGNPKVATPWIDRLAREGVTFENAHAHNVVTLPSHANILSGLIPTLHGVRDNTGFRFPPEIKTLATRLKERSFRTAAFVSAFVLNSRFGLNQGFDVYDDRTASVERQSPFMVPDRKSAETVAAATKWIDAQGDAQFFAFVHLYDPHFPYRPPEPFASRHRDQPYFGEVEAADAALEPILSRVLDGRLKGRVLVVLTADHGESLGEHGEETHGIFAYESTLRVPLVLWGPVPGGRSVASPAQHVDIVPTVLDALGADIPTELPGHSLLGSAGGTPAASSYFESLSSSLNQGWAPLRGVLDGRFKYIDLPLPELYDLKDDPGEQKNLVSREPETLDRLRGALSRERSKDRGVNRGTEDAATLERLRALGYVAAGSAAPQKDAYTPADDPKNLIEFDARTRAAVTAFMNGKVEDAIALARENLRLRPDMAGVSLQLAYLERARGDLPAAIVAAKKAVELKPLDGEAVALLGAYLTEAGRAREAVALLAPYLKAVDRPDFDTLTAFGLAQAAIGQPEAARAAFEQARAADPRNAMGPVNLGTLHLMNGDRAAARSAMQEALELDPAVAKAHNLLGVMEAQEGRPEEAIVHWRRAAEINPQDYQTLFNLARTLDRQGRTAEAEEFYRRYLQAAPRALEIRDIERVKARLGGRGQP